MIREIIPVGPLQCNCSVVGDEQTHEAMVIDPGADINVVMRIVQQHQLTVKQIVVTHAHIDHVGGAMQLKQLTGAPILLNENDSALLKMLDAQAAWLGMQSAPKVQVDASLTTGDKVKVGNLEADVLHTPGHTQGSICLLFAQQKTLIAGDTLFAGSIGRTDLPGGNPQQIIRSIHGLLLPLPDETRVITGHGPETTIGEERESNPFLS